MMDLGFFEELSSGNSTAKLTIAMWLIVSAVIGAWLW
jgi:succinate dehydrogenase / fumarate reductase cytochrome b subunit